MRRLAFVFKQIILRSENNNIYTVNQMNQINRQILRIALPSIVSNITVPLLGLVDVTIVGHMGDAVYIGAIAVGSMIFNVIYWIFGFLRMGTSGMTSQSFGRRDLPDVVRLLLRSLTVALVVAALYNSFPSSAFEPCAQGYRSVA